LGSNRKKKKFDLSEVNKLPIIILLLAIAVFIAADLLLGFDFNWVDYAIVIIIALFGIKGYITGIINTVFSVVGYLFGLLIAYLFTPKASLLIMQKTAIGDKVGQKLNELIPALSNIGNFKASESESLLEILNNVPQIGSSVSENPLLQQIMTVTKSAADTSTMYSETVVTLNDLIVYSILKIIVFIILFIAIKLIFVILGKYLSKIINTTAVMGTANRTAGMALGLATGILICYIVFVFAIPALGAIQVLKVPEGYTESVVLIWFNKLIQLII
jgi:uncharacterized membrane protein required for colicin V production